MRYCMGNTHNVRCFMSDIMTNIVNGIDKFANEVAAAWEATWPVLAQIGFDAMLNVAFSAVLS